MDRGSDQLLLDGGLDRFDAAIDCKFVEDIRNVELDCPQADDQRLGNSVVVETIHHALKNFALTVGQLLTVDLRLCNRLRQYLSRLSRKDHIPCTRRTDGVPQFGSGDVFLKIANGTR